MRIADIIRASPYFLYYEGVFYEEKMDKHQIRMEDLRAEVRKQGMSSFLFDLTESFATKNCRKVSINRITAPSASETELLVRILDKVAPYVMVMIKSNKFT
ncbi:hypothetical protein [Gracilibacillus xinjiangensis]|uniref:YetF C-terminal domain-containing protein n=1 Tax=Gracilibacillus xinjiangensis TaxID=1193282 RepID=A0ABV8WWE5_9BACI